MIFGKEERNNAVGPLAADHHKKTSARTRGILARAAYVLLSGVSGLAVATQHFAYQFEYHASLGLNVDHVYVPWKIIQWAAAYNAVYPDAVKLSGSFGLLTTIVMMFLQATVLMLRSRRAQSNDFAHGSARWAGQDDIKRAGFLTEAQDSVYVGAWYDKKKQLRYLRHSGPEHVLTIAPTRSGKGVGLVIPTLLSWGQSAFITDLKGELWALTAGWRQKHANNTVIRFEPAARHGCARWNPLEEIRVSERDGADVLFDVGDVQNLVTLIVDPDGKGLESHWQKTAFALLVGVVLHAKYLEHHRGIPATLPAVDRLLSDPTRPVEALWREMMEFPHYKGAPLDAIVQTGRDMLDLAEEEASGVKSTAKSFLSLYRDPVVAANVSSCDFHIRDLMQHNEHHKKPVSLYVITQPNDKARLRPLVRILVNMTIRLLADKMEFEKGRPKPTYDHRLLMMMDEFASLGRLDIMQESLAFVAGYGIKCYLIVQDMGQLRARDFYGPDETITGNCHVQIAFPPTKQDTAEYLSKRTGATTVVKRQITVSGKRGSPMLQNVSETYQEGSRFLLTAGEVQDLPGPVKDDNGLITKPGDMLVFAAGFPPIYGTQPLYFLDPTFAARAAVPAPKETGKTVPELTATATRVRMDDARPVTPEAARPVEASAAPAEQAAPAQPVA